MPTGRLSSWQRQKPGQIRAAESTPNKRAEGGGIILSPKHQRNTAEGDRSAHHPTRIHPGEKRERQGRGRASTIVQLLSGTEEKTGCDEFCERL